MAFAHLLRSTKSILRGKTVHGNIITSGFSPDVYTNNHLLSVYLKSDCIEDARKVFDKMADRNVVSWTTLISWYSQVGFAEEALNCFVFMVGEGFDPNHYTYAAAISACARLGAARTGKEIHGRIYRIEQELNSFVSNGLVNFYGKCGLLRSAQIVFDAILEPNLVSWTSLLSCYCQCGENFEGLAIFFQSHNAGVKINEFSCVTVLGACAALEKLEIGRQLHSHAVKSGFKMDQFVLTGLINFYAKCGKLESAHKALWEVDGPQLPAWTALIGGCVQQGNGREAIDLFCKLLSLGLRPSERTFSSVIGAFAHVTEIEIGKQIHSLVIKLGFCSFTFVGNSLVDFYSKCGLLAESLKTFEEMDGRDIVSWNALISGCVKSGCYKEAIEFLKRMLLEGFDPNLYTYSSILSICGDLPAIEWGKQIHCCILKPRFDSNVVVGSALMDMYAKCGRLSNSRKIFDNLSSKNLVSWNTMLVGYAQHGFGKEALDIYDLMQRDMVRPNDITFIGVLSACGHVGLLAEGLSHFNSMTNEYKITPRTDHLACMVTLFSRRGQTKEAYDFIRSSRVEPDKVVWRCLLSSCKTHKDMALGTVAAEKIIRIDPDDTSAHIMLSNIYAEAKMWNETAQVRKLMKDKELKKDPGYSWTELKNKIYSFSVGDNCHFEGNNAREVLSGLTVQLFDAGYVPDAMFSLHCEE